MRLHPGEEGHEPFGGPRGDHTALPEDDPAEHGHQADEEQLIHLLLVPVEAGEEDPVEDGEEDQRRGEEGEAPVGARGVAGDQPMVHVAQGDEEQEHDHLDDDHEPHPGADHVPLGYGEQRGEQQVPVDHALLEQVEDAVAGEEAGHEIGVAGNEEHEGEEVEDGHHAHETQFVFLIQKLLHGCPPVRCRS